VGAITPTLPMPTKNRTPFTPKTKSLKIVSQKPFTPANMNYIKNKYDYIEIIFLSIPTKKYKSINTKIKKFNFYALCAQ
jgi:hypothetical protein